MMPGDFDRDASVSDIERRLKTKKESDIIVFHDSPRAFSKVELPLRRLFS